MKKVTDQERVRQLDTNSLQYFATKGEEGGPDTPQVGRANAAKVRRVMQLTRDLTGTPFERLRILDLGCGEGVYAIEAGLRGASVLAVDARDERMSRGEACARLHGLDNVEFLQRDLRELSVGNCGKFDVIFALGILYHFDVPEVFSIVERWRAMCTGFTVIDTFVSKAGPTEVTHAGQSYRGEIVREHQAGDSPEIRRARLLRSIDNELSFRFTAESLVRLLHDLGFTSVLHCLVPLEPSKPDDRITLVARSGTPVKLSTYPWINDLNEAEIEDLLREDDPAR
jgi:2-polyprenyl-3-methyl-5-hydroxy-6-metoxy-1,4-benzoquinol methylase